jgi:XTP/dITP diphosphohydrolase
MTNTQESDAIAAVQNLIDVVAKLRSPDGGCPWDLAQTPSSLIPYVIEEAYEVVDAIKSGDSVAIAEELGDLLLQVVLQAQIASESNSFSLKEVAEGITQKLIRRHPHVFGDVNVQSIDEIRQNWEQIKAAEKGESSPETQPLSSKLSRYARSLPPIMAGMKISQKAAAAGFEWENVDGVWDKFKEELAEFQQAIAHESPEQQQAELGDLFFVLINLARWYKLDPSEALHGTNQRFIQRLSKLETLAGRPLCDYTLEELENLWQQAKAQLANNKNLPGN